MILQCMTIACTEKSQSGYDVSTEPNTGSGQTLQQTPKVLGSAEIMRNQVTESIVVYSLLRYLEETIQGWKLYEEILLFFNLPLYQWDVFWISSTPFCPTKWLVHQLVQLFWGYRNTVQTFKDLTTNNMASLAKSLVT